MNFENQRDKEINKSKKIIIGIIVLLCILMVATVGIILAIGNINKSKFKVYLNNAKLQKINDVFVVDENKTVYVSIQDFAALVGYTFNNGEYKHQYFEDTTKCFVTNNSEVASYTLGSDTVYKTLISNSKNSSDETTNYEYFSIDEPVKKINNKLYTTLNGISKGCNIAISYDTKQNTVTMFDIAYLVKYYYPKVTNADANEKNPNYSNQKAILYDLVISKDPTTAKYGVRNTKGEVVIGEKYKSISFLESASEFVVTTDSDKVGLISTEGKTQIEPQYDSIKQIYMNKQANSQDKSTDLYLIESDKKFGIVNGNGKIVVHIEYDKIGIENANSFIDDDIENQYLLYGECIPVKRNSKWGLLGKNGNVILPIEYDGLGCIMSNSGGSSLLLVPEYKAIVVRKDKLYGLYNSSGDELIPARVRNMYSITTSGKKEYYLTYDERYEGEILNIIDYLTNNVGIKPIENTNQEIEINY